MSACRVVDWQIACRRTTAYRGKTYAEVSGSGKKPFPQKGTGNARQGNKRAPQIRHGVVPHAPVLRDWSHNLQKRGASSLSLACRGFITELTCLVYGIIIVGVCVCGQYASWDCG